jgi:cellulose 1,4-beta-cellobiosidase
MQATMISNETTCSRSSKSNSQKLLLPDPAVVAVLIAMLLSTAFSALVAFVNLALGQQVGTNTAETHPPLSFSTCTAGGSCTSQSASIVLDSNWRWTHITNGFTNCYTGNTWNTSICPDGNTCAQNCAVDGADYSGMFPR